MRLQTNNFFTISAREVDLQAAAMTAPDGTVVPFKEADVVTSKFNLVSDLLLSPRVTCFNIKTNLTFLLVQNNENFDSFKNQILWNRLAGMVMGNVLVVLLNIGNILVSSMCLDPLCL